MLSKAEQDEADRTLGEQVRLGWSEGAKLIQGKRTMVVVASVREGKGVVDSGAAAGRLA